MFRVSGRNLFNCIKIFPLFDINSFLGKLYWHNTSESLENNSKNYIYHKTGKITQMLWIDLNSSLYLATADSEGFLCLWLTSSYVEDLKLWRK